MLDQDLATLTWLSLWAIAGAVVIWALLPPALGTIGLTTFHNGAIEDPNDNSGTLGFVATNSLLAKILAVFAVGVAWTSLRVVQGQLKGPDDGFLGQLLIIGAALSMGMVVLAIDKTRKGPVCDDDVQALDVHRQLDALGFKPIGTYWEHVWFLAYHWCLTSRERSFLSSAHGTFAAVYRYVVNEPLRVSFKTCFRGGAFVVTGNHSGNEAEWVVTDKYLRWGRATNNLAELLALHRSEVEKFQARGWVPDANNNFGTLLPIEEEFAIVGLRDARNASLLFLGIHAFCLGLLPVIAGYYYGLAHWSVPVGILAGVGLKLRIEDLTNEYIIAERRQECAAGNDAVDDPAGA